MLEFSSENATFSTLKVCDDSNPRLFGARIELEGGRLCLATLTVFENDGEGKSAIDSSTAFSHEFSGSGRMAGHQRLFVFVEDKDSVLGLLGIFFQSSYLAFWESSFGEFSSHGLLANVMERF
tara:strand:- start:194 stop:562 length:369 start_codon:yes stop_codon:yes gene_type:complete